MKGKNCVKIISTFRYRGVRIREIWYFKECIFLFRLNNFLHVTTNYKRYFKAKKNGIKRNQKDSL